MAKISPWGLNRTKRKIESFIVTDESNPGVVVIFTLQEPNLSVVIKIEELQNEYTEMYMVPDKETGEKLSLPPIAGEPMEIDETKIGLACSIFGLQQRDNVDNYSVEEILGFLETMEMGMIGLVAFVSGILERFNGLLQNPIGAVVLPPSVSTQELSTETQN